MFERARAGWRLARATRRMISSDRTLFLFPLVSALFSVMFFVAYFIFLDGLFFGFYGLNGNFSQPIQPNLGSYGGAIIAIGFLLVYILLGFISTYVMIAMYTGFRKFSEGEKIGVLESLSLAREYAGLAFKWGVFSFLILLILRIIESRFRGVAGLVIGTAGSLAIAAATFFAIPTIYEKKVGPLAAAKESFHVIFRYFGSVFGGFAYIDLLGAGIAILGFLVLVLAFLAYPLGLFFTLILVGAGISILVIAGVFVYTSGNIFKLILYDFVQGKGLPRGFEADEETIRQAIKRRRGFQPSGDNLQQP